MTTDLSSLPSHCVVKPGGQARLPLPSYAGSGNAWSAVCVSSPHVADVTVVVGAVPSTDGGRRDGVSEPPPMQLAGESLVVKGRVPGLAVWRLVLARSFGAREVAAEHELHVAVEPA